MSHRVLWIAGVGCALDVWENEIEFMRKHSKLKGSVTVCSFDNRGIGRSSSPESKWEYSIEKVSGSPRPRVSRQGRGVLRGRRCGAPEGSSGLTTPDPSYPAKFADGWRRSCPTRPPRMALRTRHRAQHGLHDRDAAGGRYSGYGGLAHPHRDLQEARGPLASHLRPRALNLCSWASVLAPQTLGVSSWLWVFVLAGTCFGSRGC